MKKLLWFSGCLAALAILVPDLVVAGLYLGVLPGVLLVVAPTVFLYSLSFTLVRRRLPLAPGAGANVGAALLTIALGCVLTAPFAAVGRKAFEAVDTGDVAADSPVRIAGDVRVERDANILGSALPRDGAWRCDALCAALLDTPGVTSVTLAGTDRSGATLPASAFRLVPKSVAPAAELAPHSPEEIVAHLPLEQQASGSKVAPVGRAMAEIAAREAVGNALLAKWALRLASEVSLVSGPAAARSDLVIRVEDSREVGFHRLSVSKVEIRDGSGTTLLRRQHVTAAPIAVPLYLGIGGAMMDQGLEVGRGFLYSEPRYFTFKPIETLFLETTLARPKSAEGRVEDLRERIAAAVAEPGLPGDLRLVEPWVATLDWKALRDVEVELLAKVIADPRVTGIDRIYSGYEKEISPRLRAAIVTRLGDQAATPQLRYRLNSLVRAMPPGTFATLTPAEVALLQDQQLRLVSDALVERLADGGASSVPLLIDILQADVRIEPWWKRRPVMASLCRALTRLGVDAAEALPVVEPLFERKPISPLANDWGESQSWRVAMVRMGKQLGEISFPSNQRPEELARDRDSVRQQVERAGQGDVE